MSTPGEYPPDVDTDVPDLDAVDLDYLDEWLAERERGQYAAPVRTILHETRPLNLSAADLAEMKPLDRLRASLVRTGDLDRLGEPVPLIKDVLFRDTLAWIAGKPGGGKTFIALDMAAHIATGLSWHDHPVHRGGVLFLSGEGVRSLRPRVRAWESAAGQPMNGVDFLPFAVHAAAAGHWQALCDLAAELQPAMIVLDTQSRMAAGMDEFSPKDMSLFVDRLENLRATCGACILTIHHTPRGGENLRGSTVLEGAANTIIVVEKAGTGIRVTCDPDHGGKQRDAEPFGLLNMGLTPRDTSMVVQLISTVDDDLVLTRAVKTMMSEWWVAFEDDLVSAKQMCDATGTARATFDRARKALIRMGLVESEGKGRMIQFKLTRDPR